MINVNADTIPFYHCQRNKTQRRHMPTDSFNKFSYYIGESLDVLFGHSRNNIGHPLHELAFSSIQSNFIPFVFRNGF